MKSEGVGSYWPFATGLRVTQANLLLRQIVVCPKTLNVLIPNQHIGAYKIGFMSEWVAREYLARHNGEIIVFAPANYTLRVRLLRLLYCRLNEVSRQ